MKRWEAIIHLQQKRVHTEIVGIQYLRGLAAALVVLSHVDTILALPDMFGNHLLQGVLFKGAVGVDLFFVISGFIITIVSLQKSTLQPRINIIDYAGKRFARIVPFLWLCVVAYAVIRFVGTGKFEAAPYLNALFLWPLGEVRPPVVWTLRHEALFYIVFALSFLGKRRRPYILFLWCLSPLVYGYIQNHPNAAQGWIEELAQFVFNPSNLTFGWGVLLGLGYLTLPAVGETKRYFSPLLAGASLITGSVILFLTFSGFGGAHTNVIAFLVVLASLWMPATSGKVAHLGRILGDASYSIYLTHNLVFLIGGAAWVAVLGPAHHVMALVLLLCASLLCGVAVHYWFERPLVMYAQCFMRTVKYKFWQPPSGKLHGNDLP